MSAGKIDDSQQILIVIPARGNSKGIPRKNLRSLGGKPLIAYAIRTALSSRFNPEVYVSSDDDEILHIAGKFGAQVVRRTDTLARDETTLDPVIYDAFSQCRDRTGRDYQYVVTLQPTSPLLRHVSLDAALDRIINDPSLDTLISATEDTHLMWGMEDGKFVPQYRERLNRQMLPVSYRETGGFLICRTNVLTPSTRIGKNVSLYILEGPEAIDIDTYVDWSICEYYLNCRKLLFVVTGHPEVGLGHVYRTLNIANEILEHDITFLLDKHSELGFRKVSEYHYPAYLQAHDEIVKDIEEFAPDIVINDILDTSEHYIRYIKNMGCDVINFEDLGPGAPLADAVINAMYSSPSENAGFYFGAQYAVLRPEFTIGPRNHITESVRDVLITFGGVDPNNLTMKVLRAIHPVCREMAIHVHVIAGIGYAFRDALPASENVLTIHHDVRNISDFMLRADIAFTSAGRTIFELASLGTPAIVIAQNEREMTHSFASEENGFLHLGLGAETSEEQIVEAFRSFAGDYKLRKEYHDRMLRTDLAGGKARVIDIIRNTTVQAKHDKQ